MTDERDAVADRVVFRYAPATDAVRERLAEPSYRRYLRRTAAGPVAVGDEFTEFVSRGCGATREVTLTVASVEGGDRVGEATDVAFVPTGDSGADGSEDGEATDEGPAATERP